MIMLRKHKCNTCFHYEWGLYMDIFAIFLNEGPRLIGGSVTKSLG